jgi:hypothetical protein
MGAGRLGPPLREGVHRCPDGLTHSQQPAPLRRSGGGQPDASFPRAVESPAAADANSKTALRGAALSSLLHDHMRGRHGQLFPCFLELFAGTARVSRAIRRRGERACAIDRADDPALDLTVPDNVQVVTHAIRNGRVRGLWIAPPCASWSRARHGPPLSSWCSLRSADHPLGLPGLSDRAREIVSEGNAVMRVVARIVSVAIECEVPVIIENPECSYLWSAPEMLTLPHKFMFREIKYDACAFGARWRKRTRLWCWGCSSDVTFPSLCHGQSLCSYSHKHHIILSGRDPISKTLWTSLACAYPQALAAQVAYLLVSAANDLRSSRTWKVANDVSSESALLEKELRRLFI